MDDHDLLRTVAQLQSRLNVGRTLAYRLATDGTIPSVRIRSAGGGRGAVRVFESDIRRYIDTIRAESRGETPVDLDPDKLRLRITEGAA